MWVSLPLYVCTVRVILLIPGIFFNYQFFSTIIKKFMLWLESFLTLLWEHNFRLLRTRYICMEIIFYSLGIINRFMIVARQREDVVFSFTNVCLVFLLYIRKCEMRIIMMGFEEDQEKIMCVVDKQEKEGKQKYM